MHATSQDSLSCMSHYYRGYVTGALILEFYIRVVSLLPRPSIYSTYAPHDNVTCQKPLRSGAGGKKTLRGELHIAGLVLSVFLLAPPPSPFSFLYPALHIFFHFTLLLRIEED